MRFLSVGYQFKTLFFFYRHASYRFIFWYRNQLLLRVGNIWIQNQGLTHFCCCCCCCCCCCWRRWWRWWLWDSLEYETISTCISLRKQKQWDCHVWECFPLEWVWFRWSVGFGWCAHASSCLIKSPAEKLAVKEFYAEQVLKNIFFRYVAFKVYLCTLCRAMKVGYIFFLKYKFWFFKHIAKHIPASDFGNIWCRKIFFVKILKNHEISMVYFFFCQMKFWILDLQL